MVIGLMLGLQKCICQENRLEKSETLGKDVHTLGVNVALEQRMSKILFDWNHSS